MTPASKDIVTKIIQVCGGPDQDLHFHQHPDEHTVFGDPEQAAWTVKVIGNPPDSVSFTAHLPPYAFSKTDQARGLRLALSQLPELNFVIVPCSECGTDYRLIIHRLKTPAPLLELPCDHLTKATPNQHRSKYR